MPATADTLVSFFEEMFTYHYTFNQRLLVEITRESYRLPERSFRLFCHMLNAHQVWNTRILGGTPFGVWDMHAMEDCEAINQQNYENTLRILDEQDLSAVITYQNSRGDAFSNKALDMLFQVANHTTHHRAQIVSDFRSVGIAPMATDYIFDKR